MPDEQQETLTLDALLGATAEPSSGAPVANERALVEPVSDLLLDLMGSVPDRPKEPLTLETLPTLPKIPLQMSNTPVEAVSEKTAELLEGESGLPLRVEPALATKAQEPCPAPEQKRSLPIARTPARKREAALAEAPDRNRETKPAEAPARKRGAASGEAPARKLEAAVAGAPVPKPETTVPEAPVQKRYAEASDDLATPAAAPAAKPERKGKHASGRVKDRAFGGRRAVHADRDSVAASGAEPPKSQPASEPSVAAPSTAEPARPHREQPAGDLARETHAESRAAKERLERLNALSRRLESEIIASSKVLDQRDEKRNAVEPPVPTCSQSEACEDSPLFEERPQSIAEGMKEGQREHYRHMRIKIAIGAVVSLLLVALFLGIALQLVSYSSEEGVVQDIPTAPLPSENAEPQSDQPRREEEPVADSPAGSTSSQKEDLSGTVVYRYVTGAPDADAQSVTESVQFGKEGLCETSTMEVEFASTEAAESFAENIRRDYGSSARSVEVDGTKVRAEIDASSNGLDREAYEDALRDSVRDLTIVKKS